MKKFYLLFLVFLAIFIVFTIWLLETKTLKKLEKETLNISEIRKLLIPGREPWGELEIKFIEKFKCKEMIKNEDWLIENCKDGIYFKVFFDEELLDPGQKAYLGFCFSSKRSETFSKFAPHFNISCDDLQFTSIPIGYPEKFSRINLSAYKICGKKVLFQDECIIGIQGII